MNELTLAEAAYLAALPKGPNNYHPFRHTDARHRAAQLGDRPDGRERLRDAPRRATRPRPSRSASTPRRTGTYLFAADYFTEEVRRELIARYGENALYEGGLSVRTTLDPEAAAASPARRCRTA